MLLALAAQHRPHGILNRFEFRAVRPLYDLEPFTVCGEPADGRSAALWTQDTAGAVAMQARAEWR
jgi:3-methylfumaryl-CoA hydratase